jgi:hypothetical protein
LLAVLAHQDRVMLVALVLAVVQPLEVVAVEQVRLVC